MNKYIAWVLLAALACVATPAHAQEDYVANDAQFVGTLGGKYKVELHLQLDGEAPLSWGLGADCIEVDGQYFYRSQLAPINLEGKFCPANNTFQLITKADVQQEERFEGKYDRTKETLTGTWTQKGGKTLAFEAVSLFPSLKAHVPAFFSMLGSEASFLDDAEGAGFERAYWEKGLGHIIGFRGNWFGYMDHLSTTRYAFSCGYNSTARSSYYQYVFQLLPGCARPTVAMVYLGSNYDKYGDGESEEDEGTEYCDWSVTVLQQQGEEIVDITAQAWPQGVPTGGERSSKNGDSAGCFRQVLSDAISLPDGLKVYWNGAAFATK